MTSLSGAVVDLHSAFVQQLFKISIRESVTRYQRIASTITSPGNRKPVNAPTDIFNRSYSHMAINQ